MLVRLKLAPGRGPWRITLVSQKKRSIRIADMNSEPCAWVFERKDYELVRISDFEPASEFKP